MKGRTRKAYQRNHMMIPLEHQGGCRQNRLDLRITNTPKHRIWRVLDSNLPAVLCGILLLTSCVGFLQALSHTRETGSLIGTSKLRIVNCCPCVPVSS